MSDIESRLRDALAARADLVQETDHAPRQAAVTPLARPWWRPTGSWLAVAAVAVVVLAVPMLVVLTGGGGQLGPSQRTSDGPSPTKVTTPAPEPQVHGIGAADVDGDGTRDLVSLESPSQGSPEFWVRVQFSSTGDVAELRLTDKATGQVVEVADVDGRAGDEVLLVEAARDDRTVLVHPHTTQPRVVSLRDGELADILDVAPSDRLAGDATYWWVRDGELWWWSSHEPVPGGTPSFAVDAVRFDAGDTLRPTYAGLCRVDRTRPEAPYDCEMP